MNYRSVHDLRRAVLELARLLPGDLDLIVGVPRSGLLAANLLALYLNLPLADVDGYLAQRVLSGGSRTAGAVAVDWDAGLKVLVLDDSVDTGTALDTVRRRLAAAPSSHDVQYGAVYVSNRPRPGQLRWWAEVVAQPRVFEWNVLHHPRLAEACMDLDGVLCRDPSPAENDDGPAYRQFLDCVPATYVPPYPVAHLVTARLEAYRAETEKWLARNQISYGTLHMLEGYTAQRRAHQGPHAAFKASVYRRTKAWLFIESSAAQAADIAAHSGRPVFCTDTYQMIYPNGAAEPAWAARARWQLAERIGVRRRLAHARARLTRSR